MFVTKGASPSAALARFLSLQPDGPLGVAVSGGSDSLALLHLLHDHLGPEQLFAVTVDHGLRPEAAAEAAHVSEICNALSVPHTTLRWRGWDGQGNVQDRARRARYTLMADWARAQGISRIALGHTPDDQAETLVMRLGRGAGVEGLAAMSAEREEQGVTFLRPLLEVRRAALRDDLRARAVAWIDDPTNDDTSFDRPRIRQALPDLAEIGLTVPALTTVAANLRSATDTLAHYAVQEARTHVRIDGPDVLLARAALETLPNEITRRLLIAALRWIAGPGYPPRSAALDRMIQELRAGSTTTLGGCLAIAGQDCVRLSREPAAVAGISAEPGTDWDQRWQIDGPFGPGDRIAATGETGLRDCANWRETGLPRTTLLAAPAVWRDGRLIAAPLAGLSAGFTAILLRTEKDFIATLRPH